MHALLETPISAITPISLPLGLKCLIERALHYTTLSISQDSASRAPLGEW